MEILRLFLLACVYFSAACTHSLQGGADWGLQTDAGRMASALLGTQWVSQPGKDHREDPALRGVGDPW